MDPLQITSKRWSMQKNFRDVAISGNSVISSKKIRVFPGMNFFDGSISEMFLMMLRIEIFIPHYYSAAIIS